jgi:hypothetical protein
MTEDQKNIIEVINNYVKSGFYSLDDTIENVFEVIEGYTYTDTWVKKTIKAVYKEHILESNNWTHPTDPEKLKEVFDQLSQEKIMALHNFGWENSDIFPVVNATIEGIKKESGFEVELVGCCGYHWQDIEIVLNPQWKSLSIGFYSYEEDETNEKIEQLKIGNRILELLKKHNFDLEWNGTLDKKICIKNFEWLKYYKEEDDCWDEYTNALWD